MTYEALATAFVLLYGGPPKTLHWRSAGFEKRDEHARRYCRHLGAYIALRRQEAGQCSLSGTMLARKRNECLRIIFAAQGRKQRL